MRSDRIEDWADFAEQLLGMQKVDRGRGALSFRMDDRKQRFVTPLRVVLAVHAWRHLIFRWRVSIEDARMITPETPSNESERLAEDQ